MDKIDFVKEAALGHGSFGEVRKAILKETGSLVAVKTLTRPAPVWSDVASLREVQCLMVLDHPNIVRLHQVIRDEYCKVHLVFEFVSGSLLQYMRKQGDASHALSKIQTRNIVYQLLQGLAHMHDRQIAHRDLKPENVLLDRNLTVKLCDFGLARFVTDEPPFTSYHATRWYRAPELLLQSSHYTTAVDIWAVGTIISELITGRPLFPGTNETNQLLTICAIKGSPTEASWPAGMALAREMRLSLPIQEAREWASVCPGVEAETIQLMEAALRWDPARRVTAREALRFPIFDIAALVRSSEEQQL